MVYKFVYGASSIEFATDKDEQDGLMTYIIKHNGEPIVRINHDNPYVACDAFMAQIRSVLRNNIKEWLKSNGRNPVLGCPIPLAEGETCDECYKHFASQHLPPPSSCLNEVICHKDDIY